MEQERAALESLCRDKQVMSLFSLAFNLDESLQSLQNLQSLQVAAVEQGEPFVSIRQQLSADKAQVAVVGAGEGDHALGGGRGRGERDCLELGGLLLESRGRFEEALALYRDIERGCKKAERSEGKREGGGHALGSAGRGESG